MVYESLTAASIHWNYDSVCFSDLIQLRLENFIFHKNWNNAFSTSPLRHYRKVPWQISVSEDRMKTKADANLRELQKFPLSCIAVHSSKHNSWSKLQRRTLQTYFLYWTTSFDRTVRRRANCSTSFCDPWAPRQGTFETGILLQTRVLCSREQMSSENDEMIRDVASRVRVFYIPIFWIVQFCDFFESLSLKIQGHHNHSAFCKDDLLFLIVYSP